MTENPTPEAALADQRIVARFYAQLQGLKVLPFALWAVTFGVLLTWWSSSPIVLAAMTVLALLAFGASLAIGRLYYQRRFGEVRRRPDVVQRERLGNLLFGFTFGVAVIVDLLLRPAAGVSLLVVAASCIAYWVWREARAEFAHYLVVALVLTLSRAER